uniref:Putative LOC100572414 [Acyrthosiphon pisum] n=1 Tax=Lepeophtheirus salmonis TaxID=72036 RepID=A0A0K2U960_LEPSM
MEQYTLEQRLQIIKIYYKSGESLIQTYRALTPIYGQRNRPVKSTIQRFVKKFEYTYTLHNVPVPVRQRNALSVKNIVAASASIQDDPNLSLTRRSQLLGISVTSLWRILRKDLRLHPYKIKLTQELKPLDLFKRREFVKWAEGKFESDPDFQRKMIFSNEAHFWLNGFVNKQNMRYWAGKNPHMIHEAPLHPQKLLFGVDGMLAVLLGRTFLSTMTLTTLL